GRPPREGGRRPAAAQRGVRTPPRRVELPERPLGLRDRIHRDGRGRRSRAGRNRQPHCARAGGHRGRRGDRCDADLSARSLPDGRPGRLRAGPYDLRPLRCARLGGRVHPQQWARDPAAVVVIFPIAQLTGEQIAIGAAAGLSAMAYAVFILAPAWTSYGRIWERVAASLLTVFILATLLGIGVAIGLAIVWGYTSTQ